MHNQRTPFRQCTSRPQGRPIRRPGCFLVLPFLGTVVDVTYCPGVDLLLLLLDFPLLGVRYALAPYSESDDRLS